MATNVLKLIAKCRDILLTKDFKEVYKNIYLFERVYKETGIHINRFSKNINYKVDFTYNDLQELSDEIFEFIKNFQQKFTFQRMAKNIMNNKVVDNEVMQSFTKEIAEYMVVDCKLRESYKILSYTALLYFLLESQLKQEDLDFVVTATIREFLE